MKIINRRFGVIALSCFIVLFIGIIGFASYKSNKERLFSNFATQLKNGNFDDIYDESAKIVSLNVSKEEFGRRMQAVVNQLKTIDSELNFERDFDTEDFIANVLPTDNEHTIFGRPYSYSTFWKLGQGDKSVTLMVTWARDDFSYRFFDLGIMPKSDLTKEFAFPTVVGKIQKYKK